MKILVTGCGGFVGSHIAATLIEQGHEVRGIDNGSMGVDFTPTGCFTTHGNLEDLKEIPPADLIVHCAARADVSENWAGRHERDELYTSNIVGTAELLEAAEGTPVVFLSTLAVYGDSEDCVEDKACKATSPYAASKLAGEALVQAYAFRYQRPWHVLRLGCVVGSHYHHGHVADFVDGVNAARQAGRQFTPRNNGETRKSMVHVLDVVDAVRMAISGELPQGLYNVAGGPWSPRDTIRVMGAENDVVWPENTHGWVGDPMAVAGAGYLKSMGWAPRRGIEQGVREALEGLGWGK